MIKSANLIILKQDLGSLWVQTLHDSAEIKTRRLEIFWLGQKLKINMECITFRFILLCLVSVPVTQTEDHGVQKTWSRV